MRAEIIRLACMYGRYGYRMVAGLMRNRGWQLAIPDRVRRIWREEGVRVPDHRNPVAVFGSMMVVASAAARASQSCLEL